MGIHEGKKWPVAISKCLFFLILLGAWCSVDGTLTVEAETSSSFLETDEDFSPDKHHLEILPEAPLSGFALVKRVDDILNLTCHVVKAESGPFVRFQLEWHLPQHINNRIQKQILNKPGALNTLQLTVSKLQESDSGKYRCAARSEKGHQLQHTVDISVLPRKGTCGEGMFMCSSKSCIPQRYKCDGSPDCSDGTDESKDICGDSPCDGKLQCDDGRCISKKYCCDKYYDANCSATYDIPCCSKLNFLSPDFPLQTHHQLHEMGFLQSTMYTIIGCAVAFVLIVTFTVIAVCRVHTRRSALANAYAAYRSDARVWSDLDSYLASSGTSHHQRWGRGLLRSDLSRSPALVLNSFGTEHGTGPNTSLLVTYNINNGVQLMGRPVEPPPYAEVAPAGHGRAATNQQRDEPPPPYVSRENLSEAANWAARNNTNSNNNPAPFLSAIFSLLVNSTQSLPPAQVLAPAAAAAVALPEEDNNNGDINGNNTGEILVRPDSNNAQPPPTN